jgi:hypothetical protein
MGKTIMIDEFHVTVIMPAGLAKARYTAVVRTLNSRRFQAKLRAGIRRLIRDYSSLRAAHVKLSR